MKWLGVVIVVICVLIVNGEEKRPQPKSNKNNPQSEQSLPPPTIGTNVVNQQAPAEEEDRPQKHPESYLSRLFSPENLPNIGLFIIGLVGTIVAVCTLLDIQKQTANTGRIAESARLNAQSVINSERPWILISISNGGSGTRYSIVGINTGRTPAANVSYFCDIAYEKSLDDLPSLPNYREGKPLPNIVVSSDNFPVYTFDTNEILSVEKREPLRKEGKKAIFWGRVLYQDAVIPKGIPPEIHESRFCYWTDPVQVEFTRDGPTKYNKHT